MTPVLIASNGEASGKALVTIGLALALKARGYKVGYLKPFGRLPVVKAEEAFDEDALFIHKTLDLKEPLAITSPLVLSEDQEESLLHGESLLNEQFTYINQTILTSFRSLKTKDFVLLGGGLDLFDGASLKVSIFDLVDLLKAKVLFVDTWRGMITVDTILGAARLFGKQFLGSVINKIPESSLSFVMQSVAGFLNTRDVRLLGTFPRDRLLEAVTVGSIVEGLGGDVLCCERSLKEFVEHFVIGAMDSENALQYFSRLTNKAVITGAHRTDILLAALETSTRCIIITGGLRASDMIIGKAISKGIPIISVSGDTFSTVNGVEHLLDRILIREDGKAKRARELIESNFDLASFLSILDR